MDGNGRWAKERGLSRIAGHKAGARAVEEVVTACAELKIKALTLYAFSTENWKREPAEVSYLMDLFRESVQKELKKMGEEGVRIRFAGQRERFSADIQKMIDDVEKETMHNDALTLWVCLSYGGRAEIVAAARAVVAEGEEITEDSLTRHLWTAGMPDPDIIIRTGGVVRLSGFLPWQAIYSELFFSDTLWPDFTKEEFDSILAEFAGRERRHGK